MDYRRFGNTIVARFDRGEEITAQLRALCEKENIRLASVEALGATDEFTVGVYNVDEHQYHALTFTGAHEIVSLTGTVNTMNGEYYSHLHMSAANESGAVVGGHLNAAGATIDDADMDAVTRQTIKAIQDITFGEGKEEKR